MISFDSNSNSDLVKSNKLNFEVEYVSLPPKTIKQTSINTI